MLGSCVGDRETRAHGQGRELIDRVAPGAPVRQLLFIETLGHARVPFAGFRPDHRAGIELAAVDAQRAAEAAAVYTHSSLSFKIPAKQSDGARARSNLLPPSNEPFIHDAADLRRIHATQPQA